ncbi:hypothetical protein VT98_10223 [Candidatus Electrothrix communis]|uniref:Ig-like domain-containing protein n=1 Tax=Candidatus Electrothrix communis TaxID=1859133 RepID=A0A3S4TG17_9BACT|nr:hypothetical protein VT98_10223 [Candidatus Electrothrix communis]
MFTFYSPGEKNIYCTSLSRQEVASPSTRKTISIRYTNQVPSKPEISAYPYNTTPGKAAYISVTAGSDPDGDMVKVQCSATDSNITGNAPYVSDWVAPLSTITAALTFYTSGDKEISCVTIDRKDAQSDEATRKIHVHSSQYNPGYAPDHNFNKKSDGSGAKDCGCQQKNTSSYPMKSNARQGGASPSINPIFLSTRILSTPLLSTRIARAFFKRRNHSLISKAGSCTGATEVLLKTLSSRFGTRCPAGPIPQQQTITVISPSTLSKRISTDRSRRQKGQIPQ